MNTSPAGSRSSDQQAAGQSLGKCQRDLRSPSLAQCDNKAHALVPASFARLLPGLCHCATSGTKPRKSCPLEFKANGSGDLTFVCGGLRGSVANMYFKVKCRALPGVGALLGTGSSTGNKARLSLPSDEQGRGPGRPSPPART